MFRLLRNRSFDRDPTRPRGRVALRAPLLLRRAGCPRTSVNVAAGQALIEFALVLVPLMFLLLAIIEGAFLFQSYLAIQHAAREAARFAITYQPPVKYGLDQVPALLRGERPEPLYPEETEPEWHLRRVGLIKDRAEEQSMGIRIMYVKLTGPMSKKKVIIQPAIIADPSGFTDGDDLCDDTDLVYLPPRLIR